VSAVADLVAQLEEAAKVVDQAGLPENLRPIAFARTLDVLGTNAREVPPTAGETGAASSPGSSLNTHGSTVLDRIATGLDVDGARIARLFAEKDGEPVLIVKSSALPKTASAAACDIALLTMAARQLGELEDYTDSEILREGVKKYGKFDSANFAASIKSLDNLILTEGKGSGVKRKLTVPGVETAAELAKKYLSEE
jgi:hypothetical protein